MKMAVWFLAAAPLLIGAEADVIVSARAGADFELTADSEVPAWKGVAGVVALNDAPGNPVSGHRTEIRSRWTPESLYLLFICDYEKLHLKPNPVTSRETAKLWNWDVAEAFIGSDFQDIRHYFEFEISPRGEYIDLEIHSNDLNDMSDMKWNSGFHVKARIDEANKRWIGEMKIPFRSIDSRPARAGREFRANFYRLQGPGPVRKQIAWRPTGSGQHHVPEAFGRLILGE